MRGLTAIITAMLVLIFCQSAVAQQVLSKGPETGLPLPRFVSVKATKARVRRGPSRDHRIEWMFVHRDIPVRVVAEHGHWRRIEDSSGAAGWMHYSLLSGRRSVLVTAARIALKEAPNASAETIAFAEAGVIARLGKCEQGWCELTAGETSGWSQPVGLWGVTPE